MQAFDDIRILDLTHVLAGPFCTYQLAVLGADVIKIESPESPDMVRSEGADEDDNELGLGSMFVAQGCNKRSLTLDLKSGQGREVFHNLVATADVLVENYRAGALKKLGLGYDQLAERHPSLIYCSLTGFGQTGPKAEHTAYDNVIQAFSGMMYTTGTHESAPIRSGSPVLDYATGAQAALAISAALVKRNRTGVGEYIDISMLDSAIVLMGMHVSHLTISGNTIGLHGNDSPTFPGYACFETRKGKLMIGAFTGQQHRDLWRALGEHERGQEVENLTGKGMSSRRKEDHETLTRRLLDRTADEWEHILNEHKVPAARVRTLDEALGHPQLATRRVLQTIESEHRNMPLTVPVAAFQFAEGGPELRTPPPRSGEHNDEVLTELGYSSDQIAALKKSRTI